MNYNFVLLDDDKFQHAGGPYRMLKIGDEEPVKYVVGTFDLRTGRISAPPEGRFMMDDPQWGTVVYDEDLRRVVRATVVES